MAKFLNGFTQRTTGWSSCLLRPVLWNRYVTPPGDELNVLTEDILSNGFV